VSVVPLHHDGWARGDKIRHLRERIVTTPKEYREYADECFGWAKTAKSDREREIFLQMAETWLEAAIRAEVRQIPVQPSPQEEIARGRRNPGDPANVA
jgi:hypothetical protein